MLQLPIYAYKPHLKCQKRDYRWKEADKKPEASPKTRDYVERYSVLRALSRRSFEQLSSGAIFLNFAVQLVDVVAHRYKEDLRKNLLVAAKQELPEAVILLDDTDRLFHHAHVINIRGQTYRLKDRLKAGIRTVLPADIPEVG